MGGRVGRVGMGMGLGGDGGGAMVGLGRVEEGGEGVSFGRLLGGLGDEGAEANLRLRPVTMLASVVVLGVSGTLAVWGVLRLTGWVTVRGEDGLRELGERSLLMMEGGKPDMMCL